MSHTIELKKVSKYYAGEESISMGFSRVDLELDMGEFVAITGESGSGKSTLLNVISGLDTYDEGEMFVCGEDTTAFNTEDYENYRKTYIGNIFQDFNLVNSYSVYQNIELVMLLCGKKKDECAARVNELIELVGLKDYSRTKASKLSGGQKQRVAIARALAKDAPIIVADEPTGNLDSESAASVMETLAKVSEEKLVVIVTHNYEQAEKYVTRKLTMHDGKIIEDRKVKSKFRAEQAKARKAAAKAAEEAKKSEAAKKSEEETQLEEMKAAVEAATTVVKEEPHVNEEPVEAFEYKTMGKGSEIRLGLRNTFNIPSKFILLFIVYLFVATAVLAQYSSVKNSMFEDEMLGSNQYFLNVSSDRVILTKPDRSNFNAYDFAKLEKESNISRIVKNDLSLDQPVSIGYKDSYIDGFVCPVSEIKKKDLTYGRLPRNDKEIVVKCDLYSDAYSTVMDAGEAMLGRRSLVEAVNTGDLIGPGKLKIVGVAIDNETKDDVSTECMGYSYFYVTDELNRELLTDMASLVSKTDITYDKDTISYDYGKFVYFDEKVPAGKAFIFDSQTSYFDGKERKMKIAVENSYYSDSIDLEVDQVITEKNIEELLGVKKEEYSNYDTRVYMNPEDYKKIYDHGIYQVSVFVDDEGKFDDTIENLKEKHFKTFALRDSLTDITGGFNFVLQLLQLGLLIVELIVLFYISYAVIKIIMRSRNQYYSTLRILGATKGNTDVILKVELVFMMLIAYAVDVIFAVLVNEKVIRSKLLSTQLSYIKPADFVILGILLIVMSLLIAGRYSRKIFAKSAMKTMREEV